jgi:hypothetical protein
LLNLNLSRSVLRSGPAESKMVDFENQTAYFQYVSTGSAKTAIATASPEYQRT